MKIKKLLSRILPAAILLAAWGISMWYVTIAGARELCRDWQTMSWEFNQISCYTKTERILLESNLEESRMAYLELPLLSGIQDRFLVPSRHLDVARYYLDENRKSTVPEGRYAVLRYYEEDEWLIKWGAWTTWECYMDMDTVSPEWERWLSEKLSVTYLDGYHPWMKLEGRLEGEKFIPAKAQWIENTSDIRSDTQWKTIFDRSNEEPQPDTLIIPIKTTNNPLDIPVQIIDTTTAPVSVGDISFDNCQAFAETWGGDSSDSRTVFWELRERFFVGRTSNLLAKGVLNEENVDFVQCVQVIRCYPLRSAMIQLLPVYLVSLAVAVLTFFLIRRHYSKSIVDTLNGGDEREVSGHHGWKELARLEKRFEEATTRLQEQTPELRRLETALRYAGDAEESRRKLISDMTHELKTPLAVIHSYAEGLSMGIAPEKQETYLQVIMEEAEKMDGLVLSMLDLSRLEAGRVRLNREPVCLLEMSQAVFEKLKPIYQEKNLHVHFFGESFETLADRQRMEQMITNLASNAVKYCTPAGGIYVTVHQLKDATWLSMENDCYRLPQKALDQIWDSFFREETARDTQGTGLGLPIVKSIVELHSGSCRAVNTDSGLEFQIQLPH